MGERDVIIAVVVHPKCFHLLGTIKYLCTIHYSDVKELWQHPCVLLQTIEYS